MKKRYEKELPARELAALPDDAIDTSDVPEQDEVFWKSARVVMPDKRKKPGLEGSRGEPTQ